MESIASIIKSAPSQVAVRLGASLRASAMSISASIGVVGASDPVSVSLACAAARSGATSN